MKIAQFVPEELSLSTVDSKASESEAVVMVADM